MNATTLVEAAIRAERFAKMAREVLRGCKRDQTFFAPSKETGAVKRASMDLTRALADMRRPS